MYVRTSMSKGEVKSRVNVCMCVCMYVGVVDLYKHASSKSHTRSMYVCMYVCM